MSARPDLMFTREDLLSSHAFARPHCEAGYDLHGGFDDDGRYISPRMRVRGPAVAAWREQLASRGGTLIACGHDTLRDDAYPDSAQQSVLLRAGLRQPLWDDLTVIGVTEARGQGMCYVPLFDFQSHVEEDLSATTVGHLHKGLFWAHGVDEAGDPKDRRLGGHDTMWFACRDTVFGKGAFPRPELPATFRRPEDHNREAPAIPADLERLVKSMMNILLLEVRAEAFFEVCDAVFGDSENFPQAIAAAGLAGTIVKRIRQDEAIHIAYLQTALSELRSFTFRLADGRKLVGRQIVDPLWARVSAWPDPEVQAGRRAQARARIAATAAAILGPRRAASVMDDFDAAGQALAIA
jgi:hypothetical protein